MTLTEKSAYLKGLLEGLKIADDDNGKVLKSIVELLDEVCNEVADIADGVDDMSEQLDAVDEDLANLEEYIYDDEDGCCCGCDDDEDDEVFEVECPECHDTIYLDYDMLEEDIICPSCGKKLELEFPECDCDSDCDCGCQSGGPCTCGCKD